MPWKRFKVEDEDDDEYEDYQEVVGGAESGVLAISSTSNARFFRKTQTGIVSVARGSASLIANSCRNNGACPKQWVSWIQDSSFNFAMISSVLLVRFNSFVLAGVNTN